MKGKTCDDVTDMFFLNIYLSFNQDRLKFSEET